LAIREGGPQAAGRDAQAHDDKSAY
jgi:hypothetical protein